MSAAVTGGLPVARADDEGRTAEVHFAQGRGCTVLRRETVCGLLQTLPKDRGRRQNACCEVEYGSNELGCTSQIHIHEAYCR
jgi:hypothetical protein